jgi:hypothetical protein
MPDVSSVNQLIPVILLVLGLGMAWLVVRFVFKLAMRAFLLGCAGIIFLGLLLYLGASNLPLP